MSFKDNIVIMRSLLCCFLALQGLFYNVIAQWPDKKIYVKFSNSKFSDILDSLSIKAGVNFSYNAEMPVANNLKSIDTTATLEELLKTLIQGEKLEYSIVDKQVILYYFIEQKSGVPLFVLPERLNVIEGHVINALTEEPLAYASVTAISKNISTVTNADGDFKLHISNSTIPDSIVVNYIGFEPVTIALSSMDHKYQVIKLFEKSISIKPVIVKHIAAIDLVRDAISAISINYPNKNAMYTAFYRETTKDETEYISVCEAVLDIAKAPYKSIFLNDQARIFKGHKNQYLKKIKNLSYKLEGGVYNCIKLDIIKERASFLSNETLELYEYKVVKSYSYNNNEVYVIDFSPKQNIDDITYQGTLYIEKNTKAIVAARFSISERGMVYAKSLLVKKQPRRSQIKPLKANYIVFYRNYNGKWHLDFTKAELVVKAKSNRFLFNSVFTSVSQMAVTEIDTLNINRFRWGEIVKSDHVMVDNFGENDNAFWGNYNIIQPEEPIVDAIRRIKIKQNLEKIDEKWPDTN
jgi:hypothetical protein